MTSEQVVAQVARAIGDHFAAHVPITRDTTPFDVPGWDSLAHFAFIIRLERLFAIVADDHMRYECETVGQLADAISARIARS